MSNEVTPILETRNLKKYFKVGKNRMLHAVDDVDLKILPGQTLGVVGESGCGKSTLGRTILRLLEPTGGEILYNGHNIEKLSASKMREYRKDMQIIFQDPYSSLNPRKSVYEAIAMPLRVNNYGSKADIDRRTRELMDRVGLAARLADAYPHELDGGRRQRICVARALALDPKFIVCDEPVSALDVSIQAQILNLLMDLQDDMDLTYMFITHDLSVVKHISNEIMVMYLGKCVERTSSREMFENPRHPYTKALLSAIPIPDISSRSKKLIPIKGEVTSPVNPKPGCRFAERCDYCTAKCREIDPELREVSPGHLVACHRLEEIE